MNFKVWLQNEEGTTAASVAAAPMASATTTADVAHYSLPLFTNAIRRSSLFPLKNKKRRRKHSPKKHDKLL